MHPRNRYKEAPDFEDLANAFPPLRHHLCVASGKTTLDFRKLEAQRALTQALLKRDFNLTLSIPDDRLCPPLPNRLNYIHWIQDILFPFNKTIPDAPIRGLDIGTGASAIYPLLACSLPNAGKWTFVGTEIDAVSAQYARQNVRNNNLESRINIKELSKDPRSPNAAAEPCSILTPFNDPNVRFDFTMCNPPFYGSAEEITESAEMKELPPNSVCTGGQNEMITPGGEKAFILQMMRDSMHETVKTRCRWYTSMVGKLTTIGEIVQELKTLKIENYALTQFVQGTTRRWAIAWSFETDRLPDRIGRPTSPSLGPFVAPPTTLSQKISLNASVGKSALKTALEAVEDIKTKEVECNNEILENESWAFIVSASENTWSRAARRKRKRGLVQGDGSASEEPPKKLLRADEKTATGQDSGTFLPDSFKVPDKPSLVCRISYVDDGIFAAQWMKGKDRELFEGFWSHVYRKLREQNTRG